MSSRVHHGPSIKPPDNEHTVQKTVNFKRNYSSILSVKPPLSQLHPALNLVRFPPNFFLLHHDHSPPPPPPPGRDVRAAEWGCSSFRWGPDGKADINIDRVTLYYLWVLLCGQTPHSPSHPHHSPPLPHPLNPQLFIQPMFGQNSAIDPASMKTPWRLSDWSAKALFYNCFSEVPGGAAASGEAAIGQKKNIGRTIYCCLKEKVQLRSPRRPTRRSSIPLRLLCTCINKHIDLLEAGFKGELFFFCCSGCQRYHTGPKLLLKLSFMSKWFLRSC